MKGPFRCVAPVTRLTQGLADHDNDAAPMLDFSIIIPTKDRPVLLRRALGAVMRQGGSPRSEIIVVDDGNGAGVRATHDVVGDAALVLVTRGLGQVAARNMAVARASGRWIAFLDDDDWWVDDDHLARLAEALASGAGLAYASGRIVPEGDAAQPGADIPFTASIDAESIRHNNTLLISGIAYERALHARLGIYDETLPVYWDWDWYLRLAAAGVLFSGPSGAGVRISVRTDTVSAPANEAVRRAELQRLCDKHKLTGVVLKNHESIAREQQSRQGHH